MRNALLSDWQDRPFVIIGMIHLGPLPGSPHFGGSWASVVDHALRDADALASNGVSGLMMENFGDAPFFPGRVPHEVVAYMTCAAHAIRERFDVPLGINVLRNDGVSALGIAHAVGASFIRVNILSGARVTDQGVIGGIAHDLLRARATLGAGSIRILADVDVKHSSALGAERPLEDDVSDLVGRGGADGLVVSGARTGAPTDPKRVARVRDASHNTPVFIGSGVELGSIGSYRDVATGAIVGSSLKVDGRAISPVDPARVREIVSAVS